MPSPRISLQKLTELVSAVGTTVTVTDRAFDLDQLRASLDGAPVGGALPVVAGRAGFVNMLCEAIGDSGGLETSRKDEDLRAGYIGRLFPGTSQEAELIQLRDVRTEPGDPLSAVIGLHDGLVYGIATVTLFRYEPVAAAATAQD